MCVVLRIRFCESLNDLITDVCEILNAERIRAPRTGVFYFGQAPKITKMSILL